MMSLCFFLDFFGDFDGDLDLSVKLICGESGKIGGTIGLNLELRSLSALIIGNLIGDEGFVAADELDKFEVDNDEVLEEDIEDEIEGNVPFRLTIGSFEVLLFVLVFLFTFFFKLKSFKSFDLSLTSFGFSTSLASVT